MLGFLASRIDALTKPTLTLIIILNIGVSMFSLLLAATVSPAFGATHLKLVIRDHKFAPADLVAPAGEVFELEVENFGPGVEEFESTAMRIEKILLSGKSSVFRVGPLKSGSYDMFGDFHPDSCRGTLKVP